MYEVSYSVLFKKSIIYVLPTRQDITDNVHPSQNIAFFLQYLHGIKSCIF